MDKISIIIPSFNQGRFLRKCFDGILNQEGNIYKEIIFVDNCSTDSTNEVLEQYKNIDNKKTSFVIIQEKDKGGMDAWNKGVKIATGDFIAFCNTSDYYYSTNWFDRSISILKKYAWISATYGMTLKLDETDYLHGVGGYRLINYFKYESKAESILAFMNDRVSWNESTVILRKEVVDCMTPFESDDPGAILTAQRAFNFAGYCSMFIQKIGSVTYVHDDSLSNKNHTDEEQMWLNHDNEVSKFKKELLRKKGKFCLRDYKGEKIAEFNLSLKNK